ncbi:MAG TPA: acetyl-CoA carboxylase biotin carboxyl carrier protein [Isosphaeraceae bacterium]|jgi:acetyl-CoA carboxylase biotin carboxyl carrier protein|nr:acetyl-CoA carboxylase biotin carboxyl carrier protein [Isosphaeraceae bacterium]
MPESPRDRESSPGASEPPSPEIRTIRRLVRLMHRYDLTAIDLDEGPTRIRLRRRGAEPHPGPPPPPPPPQVPAVSAPPTTTPAAAPAAAGPVIRSPMIGTFYSSRDPESPPYVSVGSAVRDDTTVCIIEAMKVFSEIPAGVVGTITEVLVKNGQAVEFDQPLFRYNPA